MGNPVKQARPLKPAEIAPEDLGRQPCAASADEYLQEA